jgi:large subunit ribosomal protein L25
MSKQFKIQAEMREDVGKGASRRLRRAGRVPAIIYGAGREPAMVTLDHNYMIHAIEDEAFQSSVLEVNVADKVQKVILRDLQRHPFKPVINHVDFQRIRDDEEIRVSVAIHFLNEATSPAAKAAGVVVSRQMTEVEISALPKDLPEYLTIDLEKLNPGDSIMLSQIELPAGVSIPAIQFDPSNDMAVVSTLFIRESQGTGAAAAEADAQAAEVATPAAEEEAPADSSGDEAQAEGEA